MRRGIIVSVLILLAIVWIVTRRRRHWSYWGTQSDQAGQGTGA
jgi:hypothetical protein